MTLRDAGTTAGDLRVLGGRLEDKVGTVRVWLDDGLRDEVAKRSLAARGAATTTVEVTALLAVSAFALLLPAEVEEDDDGDDEEDDAATNDTTDDGCRGRA